MCVLCTNDRDHLIMLVATTAPALVACTGWWIFYKRGLGRRCVVRSVAIVWLDSDWNAGCAYTTKNRF